MANPHKLQVGQKLWFVPADRRNGDGCEVTVEAVGRTWAKISNQYRIDLQSLIADGGQYVSPGRCYLSVEAYREDVELQRAWCSFQNEVYRATVRPTGLTVAAIDEARRLLKLDAASFVSTDSARPFGFPQRGGLRGTKMNPVEQVIRELKLQYSAQANFPAEEGETWSYQDQIRLLGKLEAYYEAFQLDHEPQRLAYLLRQDAEERDDWLATASPEDYELFDYLQRLGVVGQIPTGSLCEQ